MAEDLQITVIQEGTGATTETAEQVTPPPPRRSRRVRAVGDSEGATADGPEVETPPEQREEIQPVIVESIPRTKPTGEAKSTPPSLTEWQDFIGRIVLKTLTEAYVTVALRDIDLTDRELESIKLTKEDLADMSAPIASVVHKSKRAKKHGRSIIAAADSYEAVVALVIWMRRVRRIAKRHAPVVAEAATIIPEGTVNGNFGPNDIQGTTRPVFFNPGTG